jgi:hypothetical protein
VGAGAGGEGRGEVILGKNKNHFSNTRLNKVERRFAFCFVLFCLVFKLQISREVSVSQTKLTTELFSI